MLEFVFYLTMALSDLCRLCFMVSLTLGIHVLCDEDITSKDKRILIPNQYDVVNEINQLKQELTDQQSEILILKDKLSAKDIEVESLKATVEQLNTGSEGRTGQAAGSNYIRWGRTTCPGNNTELVYKGYMGGSPYITNGGSVGYLCLTADPQWDHYDEHIKAGTTMTGIEYEFYNFRYQDGASKFFGKNIYNDDAPCAVCHSARGSSIMIPGRTECYGGWTKEYSGYLAGEHDTSPRPSDWVCLDRRPEVLPGGKTNDNEALLYMVEASCGGSLECPPYVNGREITCVVCTK